MLQSDARIQAVFKTSCHKVLTPVEDICMPEPLRTRVACTGSVYNRILKLQGGETLSEVLSCCRYLSVVCMGDKKKITTGSDGIVQEIYSHVGIPVLPKHLGRILDNLAELFPRLLHHFGCEAFLQSSFYKFCYFEQITQLNK